MKFLSYPYFKNNVSNLRLQIYFLALTTFIVQLDTFQGEDIVNARLNYLSGNKTDFWGGASTLIYAHIPALGVKWQIWLAAIQIIFTATGLRAIYGRQMRSGRIHILSILVIYLSLVFGSQMTRDGLLFSLLMLGFGLIHVREPHFNRKLILGLAITIIYTAMSIRPWMSLAIAPLIIFFLKGQKVRLKNVAIILIGLAFVPVALDSGAAKLLGLVKSYPQQQVMIMDLAATHCYSNNEESVLRSKTALSLLTQDPKYFNEICKIYRPDTWQSLTMAGHASSKGLVTDFWLISASDSRRYELLKHYWLSTIALDPITYFQNKILFIGKLVVGSDSRHISVFSARTIVQKIESAYILVFEIAKTLHLLSIISCLFWIILIPCREYLQKREGKFVLESISIPVILSLFLWAGLSSVAYIGSNGRYTYSITILGLVLFVSHINNKIE